MKKRHFMAILSLLALFGPGGASAVAEENSETPVSMAPVPTEARRIALETAGAFLNDGFRVRDGEWTVSPAPGIPAFLVVNLFAGNRYWFVAASPVAGAKLVVTLFDSQGKQVKTEQWSDSGAKLGTRTAAGIAPERSGGYFVRIESQDTQAETCLVYRYK